MGSPPIHLSKASLALVWCWVHHHHHHHLLLVILWLLKFIVRGILVGGRLEAIPYSSEQKSEVHFLPEGLSS